MNSFRVENFNVISSQYTDDAQEFCILGHCEIVRLGSLGGEAFVVKLVSPEFLKAALEEACELGRGSLIMNDYDVRLVKATLQKLVDGAEASSWDALYPHIERYFDWI